MAFCCTDIDALVHAYLDGELATHDLEELELHLASCQACRARVDEEIAFRADLRRKLAPPRAPDLLHARIGAALDAEDRAALAAQRRRGMSWILPGAATLAAAAALIMVVVTSGEAPTPTVGSKAPHAAPIQVTPDDGNRAIALPTFQTPGVRLKRARMGGQGQSVQADYEIERNNARIFMELHIYPDGDGLPAVGDHFVRDGVDVWVYRGNGQSSITLRKGDGRAVTAMAPLSSDDLLEFLMGNHDVLFADGEPGR